MTSIKKDGYSKFDFNTSLYLGLPISSDPFTDEILFIVEKSEAVDSVLEKQYDELKGNSISHLDLNDGRNINSVKIIGEEKDGKYRSIRYSDGITKIVDVNNNWILFKTEYEKDEYTGEYTNTPINLFEYRSKFPIMANIETSNLSRNGMYRLVLSDKMATFINSNRLQCTIKANDDIFKQVSNCFFNYFVKDSEYTIEKCFYRFPNLSDNSYVVKGPNGNILEDVTGLKFLHISGNRISGIGGYFDHTTNKLYYLYGRYLGEVMQAWSLIKGSTKINSIYDDEMLLINCLSSDTITRFVDTKNMGEIYYSNGDYVKYSKLKEDAVFDCLIHRKDGKFTAKRENDKLVAQYDYTSGKYKNLVKYWKSSEFTIWNILGVKEINRNGCDIYDKKTKAQIYEYSDGSLYNTVTKKYIVLSDARKLELKEEAEKQKQKQEDLQLLYQRYGKRYVDSIKLNDKILVGTPEGLIKELYNLSLVNETQTYRRYKVIDKYFGMILIATVNVNKNTKRVSSVSY